MKFLVLVESKYPLPPEQVTRTFEGALSWADKYKNKIDTSWGVAGRPAGGAILNVNTLDELDQIMMEMPLTQFSEVKVEPITDMRDSIQRAMKTFDDMNRRR